MSSPTVVMWDDEMVRYDFGESHPMRALRLDLAMTLARSLRVFDADHVTVAVPEPADEALLALGHDPEYVAYVQRVPQLRAHEREEKFGLGTPDNPVFDGMHEAGALAVGGSVAAAQAILDGSALHAVNLSGGLHHAMYGYASGFCVYNDAVIAIRRLLDSGVERVAYVDVDAHHGDGVQEAFYADPRVLTVSLHESGRFLFPGTGFPHEIGQGQGRGFSVNVALPPGTRDPAWLRAFHAVALPAVRAFQPDVLVTQHGADTHALDPLTELLLSVDGHRVSYEALHELSHEVSGGRWLALGGGGYEAVQVVPRSWAHLLGIAAGRPLLGATPSSWREYVQERTGVLAPTMLTDRMSVEFERWEGGDGDPASRVDQEIAKARHAAFPLLGLDPLAPDA